MSLVLLEQEIEIPTIHGLDEFRRWALSDAFPGRGRIDYIGGRIEVDMSPEDLFTHGTLKLQLSSRIEDRVAELDIGHGFVGETRISSIPANLSAEPDVVVVTYDAIDSGRVRLVPKASERQGRYIEIEGGPDLVAEIVSDSSVGKDTRRLPRAYFSAGVKEFWLVDARGDELFFQIHRRDAAAFIAAEVDEEGYQRSDVLDAWYSLERGQHQRGHWVYRLQLK
ncbi:MAG: Uma2 family endonuclease [Pirellulales bacterium]|nr:Uma2 family endonuclease [Pirellulales bacterium]